MFIAAFAWMGYQYVSISHVGETSEPTQADVIIVLGAGVWPNGPSPALLARTNHAAEIYKQGFAKQIILSGGLGQYPPTEAEVMQDILLAQGIAEEVMYLETEAVNTEENLAFSKVIMEEQGWTSAIIVTDVFHLKRALLIAKKHGLTASGAPVKETVLYTNAALKFKYTLREVAAITYHHLTKWR